MFFRTQVLPRNMGAYVDIQNWQIPSLLVNLGEPVRLVLQTGQTGLGNFVKMPIGLHHCVDLVEMIEMHM